MIIDIKDDGGMTDDYNVRVRGEMGKTSYR